MKKLVLQRETTLDLSEHEMEQVGGAAEATGTCFYTAVICYTLRGCPTDNCTYTALC